MVRHGQGHRAKDPAEEDTDGDSTRTRRTTDGARQGGEQGKDQDATDTRRDKTKNPKARKAAKTDTDQAKKETEADHQVSAENPMKEDTGGGQSDPPRKPTIEGAAEHQAEAEETKGEGSAEHQAEAEETEARHQAQAKGTKANHQGDDDDPAGHSDPPRSPTCKGVAEHQAKNPTEEGPAGEGAAEH